jgi:hypothetical protein
MVLGALTILGALLSVAAIVVLPVLPTGHRPIRDAVSDYGAGPCRRWYQAAAVALAVAATALQSGCCAPTSRRRPRSQLTFLLMGVQLTGLR